jgi:HTH-type transcriptional regulator/antitoxin HigA
VNEERVFPPSKYIRDKLKERGWKQIDLARVLGRTSSKLSDLMADHRRMTPEFAQELAVVFGETPEHWLSLDNVYRLSQANYVDKAIAHRSMLLSFPFKEMQKRKWIAQVTDTSELEEEFKRFFGVKDLAIDLSIEASYKRTVKELELNNAEKAWITRAKQLANVCPAEKFIDTNLPNLESGLRRLAAKSQAVHRVPALLARYGIRFVVIEPLPRVKIDGAAFWLDEGSPVIAMSIRFDNVGSFWFTLMHEFFHIKHKDKFSFDDLQLSSSDDAEVRASNAAADALVPQGSLETFIKMYSPRFSEALINNFATQLQIHPGIIVGQLQHRKEIGYNLHRKLMVRVRELVTAIAFTDGWGHPVPQV